MFSDLKVFSKKNPQGVNWFSFVILVLLIYYALSHMYFLGEDGRKVELLVGEKDFIVLVSK